VWGLKEASGVGVDIVVAEEGAALGVPGPECIGTSVSVSVAEGRWEKGQVCHPELDVRGDCSAFRIASIR
jgi:hypothetical protein